MISEFHDMEQGLLFSSYLPVYKVVAKCSNSTKEWQWCNMQPKFRGQHRDRRAKAPNTEQYYRALTNNVTFLQLNQTSLHALLCAVTLTS